MHLSEGLARVANLRVKRRHKQSTDLEIILDEGRNREIRRILARIGHKVLRLKRTTIGTLRLGDLPIGAHRPLTREEVRNLRRHVERTATRSSGGPGKKATASNKKHTRSRASSTKRPRKKGR